jgi:hypothetical protein
VQEVRYVLLNAAGSSRLSVWPVFGIATSPAVGSSY